MKEKKRTDLLLDNFLISNTAYYEQVKNYTSNFDSVKVFNFDQLKADPESLMTEIFKFLGVNHDIKLNNLGEKHNASKSILQAKTSTIQKILVLFSPFSNLIPEKIKEILRKKMMERPEENETAINIIREKTRQEIINLEEHLEINLENWKNK